MSELQRLNDLAQAACQHPPGSQGRRRGLQRLVFAIQQSGKLWHESDDIYEEALSKTWLYMMKNLCEATTAKQAFNPELASVTHWLNVYLKHRLNDLRQERKTERHQRVWSQAFSDSDTISDPVDALPAPESPGLTMLNTTIEWLDANTEPRLHSIHVKGRPDITAQILIRKRLPPEASWKAISEELDYPSQLLSAFYHRRCQPLLREFGRAQGFLDA